MPTNDISVHDLFAIIDERRIYDFCKSYAFTHKDFADVLRKHFAKELPSPQKKMSLNELKNKIDACFSQIYDSPQFYDHYCDYGQDFLDWYEIGKDLTKVIKQFDLLVDSQPSIIIDAALYLIKEVCNQFEEDYGNEREDIDYEDLHIEDAVNIIRTAFESEEITKMQKLSTVAELEKLSHSDAFDFGSYGVEKLVEDTRNLLLTDNERVALREDAFKHATSNYDKENKAVELWDYLLSINRQQQAIAFYKKHTEIHDLRTCYVKLLIDQCKFKEAIVTLDEGIHTTKDYRGITLSWERTKLDLYEKLQDKDSVIRQLKVLFVEDNDTMEYYRHLKKLIPSDEWPSFLTSLLKKRDFGLTADNILAEIYASEKWYDRLYDHLIKADYHLLSALTKYAKVFDNDQQAKLVQRLDKELRQAMSHPHTRKEYNEYTTRLISLRNTCSPGKTLADSIVAYCRQAYHNRPALLDELKRYDGLFINS